MASPQERAISPPIEVTDMRGFGGRIWARPFIRAQRVVEEADEERAAALEAWFRDLGVSSAQGAAHPIDGVLATGGVRAAGLVLRAARCLVGEENGKVFGDAHGDAWRDARGIARRFSACAFARWPGGDVPTPFDAIEAGEILLYCAACCDDRPERRGRVVRRILSLALPFQRELMDALRRQRRAEEGRDVAAGAAAMTVVPDPIAHLAAGDDGGDLVRPPARDDPRGAGVCDPEGPEDAALKTRFLDAVRSGRPLRVRGAARPGLDVRNLPVVLPLHQAPTSARIFYSAPFGCHEIEIVFTNEAGDHEVRDKVPLHILQSARSGSKDISELNKSDKYTVTFFSLNCAGKIASPSTTYCAAAHVPIAPCPPLVAVLGETSVRVNYTVPLYSMLSIPTTNLMVEFETGGKEFVVNYTQVNYVGSYEVLPIESATIYNLQAQNASIVVTGLTADTTYAISVKALNAFGYSPPSPKTTVTTEKSEVEVTRVRSSEERDAELIKGAVDVDAENAAPNAKRAKQQ